MEIATIGAGIGRPHGSALDTARLVVRSAGALVSAKCKACAGASPTPGILHYPDSVRRLSGQNVRGSPPPGPAEIAPGVAGPPFPGTDFRDAHRRLSG
ncbi:putative transcriptional activator [Pseudomonas paraeruginosa]|uniref:Transcriptional activator n=1 Tax=Pseudomonas paraeruginosa TaxID=2994495 RepID=A0A2R3J418_9PSED|nr:putative transcriptional activator [Pseudomonas paraeruginosa]AWE95183.1 putative transcriptional activator [Pseudomonas paraeruginosa]